MNHRTLLAAGLLLVVAARPVALGQAGQPATPLTADDLLKVTTATVLDVSDDGRRVAYTTRRPLDNATTDHRRYGDPTYIAPAAVRLFVVDTGTGTSTPVLPDLADIRQAAWSHAGRRLAILQLPPGGRRRPRGAPARLGAGRGALRDVPSKATPASRSTRPGLVARRQAPRRGAALAARDDEARKRFKALTDGPIIVHSSKDPFLEWDDLGRASRWRALAEVDLATGQPRIVLPERKISSYSVARDGTFLTFQEDVTEKTDYDVIGGTDNALRMVQTAGGDR